MSAAGQTLEILTGIQAIAKFLDVTDRQAKHWAYEGRVPTFKVGATVCATRAELREWLKHQQQDASR